MPSLELVANVAVGGILAGLVYGLMALGLSVIFGVVRVVNFAHGEMMTIAMYLAVVLFSHYRLDPLVMMVLSTPERNCVGEPEQKSISTASKKAPDIGGLLAFAFQSCLRSSRGCGRGG